MSGKYSDSRFFFARYGCCIPTESYAWILVVLFVTSVLVLLFCMLATATVRWLYKRRMRKRLQDLKHKFQMDQLKAQEFEAKLNFMAQKNRNLKTLPSNDSKDGKSEKLTIFVDPAENFFNSKKPKSALADPSKSKSNPPIQAPPIYDRDETPIAQSTLATSSAHKIQHDNRWYMPHQQHQQPHQQPHKTQHHPVIKDSMMGSVPPAAPVLNFRGESAQHAPPAHLPMESPLRTDTTPLNTDRFEVSPMTSQMKKVPPTKRTSKELAAPPTTSGSSEFTSTVSTQMITSQSTTPATTVTTTTKSTTATTGTSSGAPPTTGTTGSVETPAPTVATAQSKMTAPATGVSTAKDASAAPPSTATDKSNAKPPVPDLGEEKEKESPDEVKGKVQYNQDDIVSPRNSEKGMPEGRKKGGGGRSEWKYYYANSSNSDPQRCPPSSITKSSTSRPSSRSWLFDSTGSNRFEAAKEVTSRSSSIIKTDSSQYRTASVEIFPHGAFDFQQ